MKPDAILLNVARGGVLDEAAVAEALREGRLGGAGIDVFEQEPPSDSPLLDAPNTVLTPHLGASTAEAQVLVSEEVAAQILDVLDGRPARYAVSAAHPRRPPGRSPVSAPGRDARAVLRGQPYREVRTLKAALGWPRELASRPRTPLTAAVLRGLIETATTERVNLVNATALARARGITLVERKTPEAGQFASLLTLSGETGGLTTTVGGTVAAGEPRLVRLDDYWLDMTPTTSMLVTRHHDRPGTMGRIGLMLGEADVNISAMHLARSAPRADALMILAVDEEVPAEVASAIRALDAVLDVWTIRLGAER